MNSQAITKKLMDKEIECGVFLSDYTSFHNGTQMEFGHWIDFETFADIDDLNDYIEIHFKEADEKSPLSSPREEVMITNTHNIPECLYKEAGMNLENALMYSELTEDQQIAFEILVDNGCDEDDAFSKCEDLYPISRGDIDNHSREYFDELYPTVKDINCDFVNVNYNEFQDRTFTEHSTVHGEYYLNNEGW